MAFGNRPTDARVMRYSLNRPAHHMPPTAGSLDQCAGSNSQRDDVLPSPPPGADQPGDAIEPEFEEQSDEAFLAELSADVDRLRSSPRPPPDHPIHPRQPRRRPSH